MSKLPVITGREALLAFNRLGFQEIRLRGSHHVLRKPGHKYHLTVPVHGNKPIPKGTLRALIRGAGISIDDFVAAIR